MTHRLLAIAGAVIASAVLVRAEPWHSHPGTYFASQRAPVSHYGEVPKYLTRNNDLPIILSVTRKMGIPDDLAHRVCHVESRCRVNGPPGPMTKHGRHYGAYQTRVNVAKRFGYTRAEGPLVGMVALKYGAAHLADCWQRSGKNRSLAARCHVSGPGVLAGKRLAPWAERYAQRYTRQVINGHPPSWAGRLQVAWN